MSLRSLIIGGATIQGWLTGLGIAVLRVFSGLSLAFAHGIFKIPPSEAFVAGVGKLGFTMPVLFAWAAGLSEFVGGLLLAVGLLTRPSAFFILITMLVAGFIRHAPDPFTSKEKALLYACIAFLFLLVGAGRYGIDNLLRRSSK